MRKTKTTIGLESLITQAKKSNPTTLKSEDKANVQPVCLPTGEWQKLPLGLTLC